MKELKTKLGVLKYFYFGEKVEVQIHASDNRAVGSICRKHDSPEIAVRKEVQ
jgi:hypothetical protein